MDQIVDITIVYSIKIFELTKRNQKSFYRIKGDAKLGGAMDFILK